MKNISIPSVIIPTYNEKDNITKLIISISETLKNKVNIIVVDDNSPDGTGVILENLKKSLKNLYIIHRPRKMGLGSAHIRGMKKAIELGSNYILTMDADFSHNPKYLPDLMNSLVDNDVVIGSRYVAGGKTNHLIKRRLLSKFANLLARVILNFKVHDVTSGYRGYKYDVLKKLPLDSIRSDGYSFLTEILFACKKGGFSISEVPIFFKDRRFGSSKINKKEIFKAILTLFQLHFYGLENKNPRANRIYQENSQFDYEWTTCLLCSFDKTKVVYPSTIGSEKKDLRQSYFCTSSGYGIHPPIVQCLRCGLIYTNPRRKRNSVFNAYKSVIDSVSLKEKEGRVITFRKNIQPILQILGEKEIKKPKILDVGCHVGTFLEVAKESGMETWGVEPSTWAAKEARKKNINIAGKTLTDAKFRKNFFDVVTMWDVIEHFHDPLAELKEVYRVLSPGGIVVLHTMDIDSWFSLLMRERWPWLMEMHLYFFTPETLGKLLKKAGFKVITHKVQGRYLSVEYFLTRLTSYNVILTKLIKKMASATGLERTFIPVNFGDLFTIYAQKTE